MDKTSLTEKLNEFLSEWAMLARLDRLARERRGESELLAPAWASRKIEERINRYLGKESETMSDQTAQFVVKALTEYEDGGVAFLVPVHPDNLPVPDRIEEIPDSIYDGWYDDTLPDVRMLATTRDDEISARGPFMGGKVGVPVRLSDNAGWRVGDVVEMTLRTVGREDELTEPLRSAIATLPVNEKSA